MIGLFAVLMLYGETRVYEEKTGNRLTIHRFVIEESTPGYNITLRSETGGQSIDQKYKLQLNLDTLSWDYDNPGENTKITALKKKDKIYLKGIHKGKQINKTFTTNDLPWNQSFNIGLEKFALSTEKSLKFRAIGTSGPGDMKITTFSVKKENVAAIIVGSKKVEALHVQISLSGLLSIFWKGNYYYRKADGTFLSYRGKGRGSIPTVMELTSE
jgi:hypothetical protein